MPVAGRGGYDGADVAQTEVAQLVRHSPIFK